MSVTQCLAVKTRKPIGALYHEIFFNIFASSKCKYYSLQLEGHAECDIKVYGFSVRYNVRFINEILYSACMFIGRFISLQTEKYFGCMLSF